jgi:NADH-quinone oxidoreductase subunit N
VVIVIGSMISLGYYLPVIATMWMSPSPAAATSAPPGAVPAIAGGSPELDDEDAHSSTAGPPAGDRTGVGGAESPAMPGASGAALTTSAARLQPEVAFVAVLAGAATVFFGIVPQPLFNLVHGVGSALGLL